MNWLRAAGLAYRIRAIVLILSFAIGSLIARDALLVHQTLLLRAQASTESTADQDETPGLPAFEQPSSPRLVKLRPSGISRRTAMNPWDPPDDDDELDQDSDTVAAVYATLAVLPAAFGGPIAPASVTAIFRPTTLAALTAREARQGIWSRGPPA